MGNHTSARRFFDSSHEGLVLGPLKQRRAGGEVEGPLPPTPVSWSLFLLPLGLFALVLAGGGKSVWTQGAFVGLVGVALLVRPPQHTLDIKLDWTAVLLVGLATLAFMPSGWFSWLPSYLFGRPDWWRNAERAGLDLPVTIAAQPWRSVEALVLLVAGLSFIYLLINSRYRSADRWRVMQLFTLVGGALAWLVVVGTANHWQYPLTERAASYSFFDNRNQTSILLTMIGVVSLAMSAYGFRFRRGWGLASALAFLGSATAVSMSLSRAGLVLFVLGCGVWVILRFSLHGGRGRLRILVPLVALSFSVMLITGQHTLSRFSDWLERREGVADNFRWAIYQDSMSMVATQPMTGVGLGNFDAVFPQYRQASLSPDTVIHPESDWMWVASEMGVPGLSVVATLVFFLFWKLFPFGQDRLVSLRAAALLAALVFALHTLVDVSGHRMGVILVAIWLYRMAMPRAALDVPCFVPCWAWRVIGAVLVIAGVAWIAADTAGFLWHSSVIRRELPRRVEAALEANNADSLGHDIDTALGFLPLSWELRMQRAQARLYLDGDTNGAREDFRHARLLEPVLVAPALYEGQVWLPRSTHYAAEAWEDALGRQTPNPRELYEKIVGYSQANPRFARELDRLSQQLSAFRLEYLRHQRGRDFLRALNDDLRRYPDLAWFEPAERQELAKLWMVRGDGGQLVRFLIDNPEAVPNSWYFLANAYARLGNYQRALEIASPYVPVAQIPVLPSYIPDDLPRQRAAFAANPSDVVRGGALLQAQLDQQDSDGALDTLKRLRALDEPPLYADYWWGEIHRLHGNEQEAWEGWNAYLDQVIERDIELKSAPEMLSEGIDESRDNPLLWRLAEPFQRP